MVILCLSMVLLLVVMLIVLGKGHTKCGFVPQPQDFEINTGFAREHIVRGYKPYTGHMPSISLNSIPGTCHC